MGLGFSGGCHYLAKVNFAQMLLIQTSFPSKIVLVKHFISDSRADPC